MEISSEVIIWMDQYPWSLATVFGSALSGMLVIDVM